MKNYYRLLNYELISLLKPLIFLCLGTIIILLLLLNQAMQDYGNHHDRFENIYLNSGCIIVFAICFAALCGLCIKNIYGNYWGNKSIYTLMTLPIKKEIIYFSKLTAFFICFIGLIAAQLISVFLGYALFSPTLIRTINGEVHYPRMHNGLFLAFIRSDFLRIILPLSMESFISSLAVLIAVVSSLYYAVLCERSHRYSGIIFVIAAIILIVYTLSQRISMNISLYLMSLILLLFSTFFIWHGIRLVKRSAIV